MARKKSTVAGQIGRGLAHIQDFIDVALGWAFRNVKTIRIEEDPETDQSWKRKGKRFASGLLSFIGEMGEQFYAEYDHLKSDRTKRAKKPSRKKKT